MNAPVGVDKPCIFDGLGRGPFDFQRAQVGFRGGLCPVPVRRLVEVAREHQGRPSDATAFTSISISAT